MNPYSNRQIMSKNRGNRWFTSTAILFSAPFFIERNNKFLPKSSCQGSLWPGSFKTNSSKFKAENTRKSSRIWKPKAYSASNTQGIGIFIFWKLKIFRKIWNSPAQKWCFKKPVTLHYWIEDPGRLLINSNKVPQVGLIREGRLFFFGQKVLWVFYYSGFFQE